MGSEEQRGKGDDGVRLVAVLLGYGIDFTSTVIGLWDCRRKGCSKRDKALLRKRWLAYVRGVRNMVRRVVRSE
jgi:hypothetical protein